MAAEATKVNQVNKRRLTLKRLTKKRRQIGTGDGGLMSDKILVRK